MSGIIEDEIIGSQSEESEQHDNDEGMGEVLSLFGIEDEEDEKSYNDKTPAKEDVIEDKKEPRTIKVKHNKEEIEADVSDEKLPELVQRSLALDKERERRTESERNLDRAAKLAGYKDHAAYVADFDNIEKQQQQKEQNAHNQLLAELREQAEDAGLDGDKIEAFLMNHPVVKEAERVKQERETERVQTKEQEAKRETEQKWNSMYSDPRVLAVFPTIVEDSQAFERGETATFFTPEMQERIQKGYDPIDAIMLAHADKFQGLSKKKTEQRVIKEQHLGLRSRVETTNDSDKEPSVPNALASAFAAFGLPVDSAKKYMTK
jgi:hypothetical protein